MQFLVSMGIPAKDVKRRQEGFKYAKAVMQVLDWDSKKIIREISHKSSSENLGAGLSQMFKGAMVDEGQCYVVSNTEVLRYDLNNWELTGLFTDESFNDLHGVLKTDAGVYVCNTGLEIVQCITDLGSNDVALNAEFNLAEVPTWHRFDKSTDYRAIPTTKPHEVHINHLFVLDGRLWVNLGSRRKAVCISDPELCIDMDAHFGENEKVLCHDGLVKDDKIYFTSVNGSIIIVNRKTLKVEERLDLNAINTLNKDIGWTRGLEIVGNKAYVGITKVRHSKFKEYTRYLVTGERTSMPSSIIEVDLERRVITEVYEAQNYQGHGIYSIIKLPE